MCTGPSNLFPRAARKPPRRTRDLQVSPVQARRLTPSSHVCLACPVTAGPPAWHPASDSIKKASSKARLICEQRGVDLTRLAIRTSVQDTRLPTTLVSAAKLSYITANLEHALQPLTPGERDALEVLQSEVFGPLGTASWEGVEVGRYWEALGKKLQLQRLYGAA